MFLDRIKGQTLPLSLVMLAIFICLLPHPHNFTSIGAACLFAGARLRGWIAFSPPLLFVVLAAILGVPSLSVVTPFLYLSYCLYVLIGRSLGGTSSLGKIGVASIVGSTQFFLITNFGLWIGIRSYPLSLAGLIECYAVALPYFGRTLVSDLIYTVLLFVSHELLTRKHQSQAQLG